MSLRTITTAPATPDSDAETFPSPLRSSHTRHSTPPVDTGLVVAGAPTVPVIVVGVPPDVFGTTVVGALGVPFGFVLRGADVDEVPIDVGVPVDGATVDVGAGTVITEVGDGAKVDEVGPVEVGTVVARPKVFGMVVPGRVVVGA